MLLAIDAGNTNTVFAVYDDAKLLKVWRLATSSARTADEYLALLYPLFTQNGLDLKDVTAAILSSVVPDANVNIRRFCETSTGCDLITVKPDTVGIGINIRKKEEVGADRLVNAVAVVRDYDVPCIVIDFGTATTFDMIDDQGRYNGGIIAPGVNLSMTALHQAAARLPRISVKKPSQVIGKDTVSAMQSGIYWGYVSMIEGLLDRMTEESGYEKPLVIATGGLARLFSPAVPQIDKVDEDLTLKGLWHIYRENFSADAGQQVTDISAVK